MSNTIFRTRKNRDNPYVMVHQDLFSDKRLSWEARGMLGYLLSKPDDWEVRFYDLVAQDTHSGRERTRRILAELGKAGYIRRRRERQPNGTFRWITTVYENPENITDETDAWESTDGSASDGFATTGSATTGSATGGKPVDILNTDVPSTDVPITDEPNTEPPITPLRAPTRKPTPSAPTGARLTPPREAPKPHTKKGLTKDQEQVRNHLMNVFLTSTDLPGPASYAQRRKVWFDPLEQIAAACEWDDERAAALVKAAIAAMDKKGLGLKCPSSILNVALTMRRRGQEVDADFDEAWKGL